MPMRDARVIVKGVSPLLMNNPQTVDRFNQYAKAQAAISAKGKKRTDEDYMEYRELEMKSKIYFDEKLGAYAPATWFSEAIATRAFRVAKISRADIRGALFTVNDKLKLQYRGEKNVKEAADIWANSAFIHLMTVPQGQSRVVKACPIFHDWMFQADIEFDDKIIDPSSLTRIAGEAGRYGGFGDFRPTFGRAQVEVIHA